MDADVVIVGAGLAGLRCADRLTAASRTVVVVERDDVIGGRQRTDEVDGFLLDRGFQVLNSAYPALRRWVDVRSLDLAPFDAGVLVRREHDLVELAHPVREPQRLIATLRSGLVSPVEVLAVFRWAVPALLAPRRLVRRAARGHDRGWRAGLDHAGVRGRLRTEVLEPFLAGVLAEDDGSTSDSFVRLLVRMFALGVPGLPARGIRALPELLAARATGQPGTVEVRCGSPVVRVSGAGGSRAGGGAGGRAQVELAGGETLRARAVVVAVGAESVTDLVDVGAPATNGLRTWWFAATEAPTTSSMIALDGRRRGPMVNAAVVSNVARSYAPPGQHLLQVTTLLRAGDDGPGTSSGAGAASAEEAAVRRQAGEVFGADAGGWLLLRRDDIRHALPVVPPPLRTRAPVRVAPGVYLAGDHRDTASIQGALVSGHRVAAAVLADLDRAGSS
jgi:2-polyprenyl-6-methoxyphenol hydroxylase-like FAD-dependent oxidoreductase